MSIPSGAFARLQDQACSRCTNTVFPGPFCLRRDELSLRMRSITSAQLLDLLCQTNDRMNVQSHETNLAEDSIAVRIGLFAGSPLWCSCRCALPLRQSCASLGRGYGRDFAGPQLSCRLGVVANGSHCYGHRRESPLEDDISLPAGSTCNARLGRKLCALMSSC